MPVGSRDSEADLPRSCSCVQDHRASVELGARSLLSSIRPTTDTGHWFD